MMRVEFPRLEEYTAGRYADLFNVRKETGCEWDAALVTSAGTLRLLRHGRIDTMGIRHGYEPSRDMDVLTFDVLSNDRVYWVGVARFLEWLARVLPPGNRHWARVSYKTLRQARHAAQAKEWDDVLEPGIARWAEGELRRASAGLDCVDNFRVARVGNTGQVRRYRRQKAHGCCGFSDFEAVAPDGKAYMLGFNYGH
jgi:hypothetical protein